MKNSLLRGRLLLFAILAVGGCAWDLYTKNWSFHALKPPGFDQQRYWVVPEAFSLLNNLNHGALFGVWQGGNVVFAGASALACLGILAFMFFRSPPKLSQYIALGLVMAGAMGNLYDRLGLHGLVQEKDNRFGQVYLAADAPAGAELQPVYAVRDFLYFKMDLVDWDLGFARIKLIDWPIFNFADVFLVTGACLLILPTFFARAASATPDTKGRPATVGSAQISESAAAAS